MSACTPTVGCGPDTHNLHCGYPDCEKGRADRVARPTEADRIAVLEAEIERLDAEVAHLCGEDPVTSDRTAAMNVQGDRPAWESEWVGHGLVAVLNDIEVDMRALEGSAGRMEHWAEHGALYAHAPRLRAARERLDAILERMER